MNAKLEPANLATRTGRDPRWKAVVARDPNADGWFYYSVSTTGVYCKPSCASRQARPENVRFHASREAAENAGFRPCKRCKPDQPALSRQHAQAVATACRLIETSEEELPVAELAGRVRMSSSHFHRLFKAHTGLTPKEYATTRRAKRVRRALGQSATVTAALFDAGYNSGSRFYEKSNAVLGMTPTKFRAGGVNLDIRFAIGECSLGSILVAQSDKGVCAILMGDDPEELVRDLEILFASANLIGGNRRFERVVATVVGFVEAPKLGLELPLDIRGTAFQQRVWRALQKIPAGRTVSYADIAKRIGSPKAVRAVAGAGAANAIAIAIPCHRVVRTDGSLSGYRWGVERKRALLKREAGE